MFVILFHAIFASFRFCFGLSDISLNQLLFLSSFYLLSFNLFHCNLCHFVDAKLPFLICSYHQSQENGLFIWTDFFWTVIRDSSYITNDNGCILFWYNQKYSILCCTMSSRTWNKDDGKTMVQSSTNQSVGILP